MDPELLIRSLKAVVEVAGFSYLAQGIIFFFAGERRHQNIIWQVFNVITGPVTKATRFVMPKFVLDRFIPFAAFGLLLWAWILLIVALARVLRGG